MEKGKGLLSRHALLPLSHLPAAFRHALPASLQCIWASHLPMNTDSIPMYRLLGISTLACLCHPVIKLI